MIAPAPSSSGTTAPEPKSGGFPPFDARTFESQFFWLVITFGFLFVVLWRLAGPRIQGIIAERRDHIAGDLATAQAHRRDAEEASKAYDTALAAARARAQSVADDNRKRIAAEVERSKAQAESDAGAAMAKAEAVIAKTRDEAKSHVAKAAQDAAISIVARLTGDTVTAEDAASAVAATGRS
jgi:F-type H+-transporting ATPase subunit b